MRTGELKRNFAKPDATKSERAETTKSGTAPKQKQYFLLGGMTDRKSQPEPQTKS